MAEPYLKRQQPLATLPEFTGALAGVFAASSPEVQRAVEDSLFGQCVLCGIQVNGRELAEASCLDATAVSEGKLARLKLGYCARNRCTSSIYELSFHYHPDLSWGPVLGDIEKQLNPVQPEPEGKAKIAQRIEQATQSPVARNCCAVVVAVIAMFVAGKFYFGGSIPIFREAEEFKVAPRTVRPSYDDPFGVKALGARI